MLVMLGEFTRRCLAIVVARRLRSDDVLHCLADLFVTHGPTKPAICPLAGNFTWPRLYCLNAFGSNHPKQIGKTKALGPLTTRDVDHGFDR